MKICKRGKHELTKDNIVWDRLTGHQVKRCKLCKRENAQKKRESDRKHRSSDKIGQQMRKRMAHMLVEETQQVKMTLLHARRPKDLPILVLSGQISEFPVAIDIDGIGAIRDFQHKLNSLIKRFGAAG